MFYRDKKDGKVEEKSGEKSAPRRGDQSLGISALIEKINTLERRIKALEEFPPFRVFNMERCQDCGRTLEFDEPRIMLNGMNYCEDCARKGA